MFYLFQMLKQGDCNLTGIFTDILTLRNRAQLKEIFAKFNEVSQAQL